MDKGERLEKAIEKSLETLENNLSKIKNLGERLEKIDNTKEEEV